MLKYSSFLFILVCLSVNTSQAQNYNNPGGTITTCSGNFYDTGGPSGTHSDDENITTTFCPTAANKCLSITFTSFDLELSFDELAIYDGPTSSYPLIGSYTGTNSPGTVTAHNGCLTFIFDSDFSINHAGWQAGLDCVPCPPPPPCTGTAPSCNSSPPDICANACNLGTLNTPPVCPSSGSAVNVFCLSNVGATPSAPYLYLTGCQPSGGDMAAPAADVWYTFIASSNIIDISITGLRDPNIGLYEGNNCNTFIGRGCAVGAFGNLNATFQPIMAGRKYYLQISGGDTTETSDFTLTISGRNDCDPCVINAGLTASPLPLNGVYHGGTTVHFCLTITRWNPTSVNWLHGIVPTFGECWDLSSLIVYPPASCDNYGTWSWYNSVTSSQTGNVTGPGFFYESSLGCSVCDPNDPGDNYGDNCTGTVNFVFCWDITVAQCITGNNLNVSVNTYGDGETGSWTSYACAADPVFDFFATYASCSNPVLELKGVTCNGAADGRAIAEGQGASPFNFVWRDSLGNILKTSTGRSDFDTLSALPGGKYTLEQTNAVQCFNSIDFIIDEHSPLIAITAVSPLSCNASNDGSIDIALSGGAPPYEFSIDGINFQSSNVFADLNSGSYTVFSKDDSSCVLTENVIIPEPDPLIIKLDSIINSSCSFSNNGAILITVSGGTIPYSITWSNSAGTEDVFNLSGGDYVLTVADANACNAIDTFSLINYPGISLSISSVNVLCGGGNDGSIDLNVNGGTGPFIFSWFNLSLSEDLNGIPSGTYTVIVTDANQCPDTATVVITEPLPIALSGNGINLLCNGDNSGAIDLNASGGVPPFSFVWSNNETTKDITGVAAGNYSVTSTDANLCSVSLSFSLTQPDAIALSSIKTDVSCSGGNNGAIDLSVDGGVLPYQFIWSNSETTEDIAGLSANVYDVIVIDSNSCTATSFVTITEPAALIVNGIATDVLCNGGNNGSVNITASGGVVPYSYQWSNTSVAEDLNGIPAGNYMVTVSDENQCSDTLVLAVTEPTLIQLNGITTNLQCNGDNSGEIDLTASGGVPPYSFLWSNNAVTEDIYSVAAENFLVTTTDVNGCTATTSFTLTQPDSIELTHTVTNVSCAQENDGAINLTVNGGTLPYQFIWSNNEVTKDIAGLSANVYDVIVIDFNTCNITASFAITEPSPLSVTGVATDVLCNGESTGAVNITINGGVTPYNYQWSNSATLEDLIAVKAGTYTIIVNDSNNCTATSAFIVHEPDSLILSGFATDARCFTSNDGEITLSASGGIFPYEFSIGTLFQTSPSFTNVSGENYLAVVRDANNCSDSIDLVINTPPPIITVITTNSASCFDGRDGMAIVTAAGTNGPFTYRWSNNVTSDTASNLPEGIYSVTVTDYNSCLAYDTTTVSQPSQIELTAVINDLQCNGESNGSIYLNVSGGIPAYTYLWSGNQTTKSIDSLSAGDYSVTVTDNNNCTVNNSYAIIEPSSITLLESATPVVCYGDSNGIATVTASGGSPLYAYHWDAASGNQTTSSAVNLPSGTYDVVVTDAHNCTATISAEVSESQQLAAVIDTFADPLCQGESSGFALVTTSGGTGSISYLWSNNPPANNAVMTEVGSGTYEVTATDGNGCTASASVILNEPPPLSVTIFPTNTTITYGDSVTLHAVHSPADVSPSYVWEPSNLPLLCVAPCADPTVVPSVPTTFTVYLTVQGSTCSASAQAIVDVVFDNIIHAPNVFTPDGDGVNDEFEVFYSPSLTGINYKIFNRWGEKLFETHTIGDFWDGTFHGALQNPGVYVYWVEGSFLNGEKKQYKGSFTLMR